MRHHASLLRSALEMQPWGLCQELSFWGRSELWPARLSASLLGPPFPIRGRREDPNRKAIRTRRSDPRQRPPAGRPLKAPTGQHLLHSLPPRRRCSNPQHLLQSLPQQRSHCPPHLWGQRPKILCRRCKPWSKSWRVSGRRSSQRLNIRRKSPRENWMGAFTKSDPSAILTPD